MNIKLILQWNNEKKLKPLKKYKKHSSKKSSFGKKIWFYYY